MREDARSVRLALGGAQFGLDYGVVNHAGKPSAAQVFEILRWAVGKGVSIVDTARAYGDSELVIGDALNSLGLVEKVSIVTKLDPLSYLGDGTCPDDELCVVVDRSIQKSMAALRLSRLETLMLHRWEHRHWNRGALWRHLLHWRGNGGIDRLGASVSSPAEALEALADEDVGALQLPFNLLDQRWLSPEFQSARMARRDVVVYARSAYLQGLLIASHDAWPNLRGVDASGIVAQVERLAVSFNRSGKDDLALAFVRAQGWLDVVVVGAESLDQVIRNVNLMHGKPLEVLECEEVLRCFAGMSEELINPALWPLPSRKLTWIRNEIARTKFD